MSQDPTSAYINYLYTENCYVESKCEQLMMLVESLESNVCSLNHFIQSTYDLSMNSPNCVHITTYDSMGNALSCVNYDTSGNFSACESDMSGNFLPCVLPPVMNTENPTYYNFPRGGIPYKKPMVKPNVKPNTKPRGYPIYPYSGYPYCPDYPYYPYRPYYPSYYDPYYN